MLLTMQGYSRSTFLITTGRAIARYGEFKHQMNVKSNKMVYTGENSPEEFHNDGKLFVNSVFNNTL